MAEWCEIDLKFTARPPDKGQLAMLQLELYEMDYDFPSLNIDGLHEVRYRNPLLSLDEILKFFHNVGWPCKGRMRNCYSDDTYDRYYCEDCGNWTLSK